MLAQSDFVNATDWYPKLAGGRVGARGDVLGMFEGQNDVNGLDPGIGHTLTTKTV